MSQHVPQLLTTKILIATTQAYESLLYDICFGHRKLCYLARLAILKAWAC